MNCNRIKSEGFSNPETERFFKAHWTYERQMREMETQKTCGFCLCAIPIADPCSVLCLNADSPYCYETVSAFFSCVRQELPRL